MVVTLRELRKQNNLTQAECAGYLGVPIRTYQNYETDARKRDSLKYRYMLEKLEQYGYTDEENGILTIQKIKTTSERYLPNTALNIVISSGRMQKERPRRPAM